MGDDVKYPQSVSFHDLFPWLDDTPVCNDIRLHKALKRYSNDRASGRSNGDSFVKYLEKRGLYTTDEIRRLSEQFHVFPNADNNGTRNPKKTNGHRGGIYTRDGK